MDKSLYLSVLDWQASGESNELYYGAQLLTEKLSRRKNFISLRTPKHICSPVEQNIFGYREILKQMEDTRAILDKRKPTKVFTVGGTCAADLIPISYLNAIYDNLAILWFDAHADLNTPESSPSKHFHGMPLRTLLGEGDRTIVSSLYSQLMPQQVFLIGSRDTDLPEREFIQSRNIRVVSAENVQDILSMVTSAGFQNIYIRIDLDVLDPDEFPWVKCPTSGGISIKSFKNILGKLRLSFNQIGLGLMEFVANGGHAGNPVDTLLESIWAF